MPTGAIEDFCVVSKPMMTSTRDTLATVKEIVAHNAYGAKHCGWKFGAK